MRFAAVKAFFPMAGHQLPCVNVYTLAELPDFTQVLIHHRINTWTFTVFMAHFVKPQADKTIYDEERFRQKII